MLKNDVIAISKKIDQLHTETFKNKTMGSRCVYCAGIGYMELLKLGYDVKLISGFSAFSVNKTSAGLMSFGAESTHQYKMDHPENQIFNGHFWLRVEQKIIDFSLPYLNETRDLLDKVSGVKTGAIEIDLNPIVPISKVKTLRALQEFQLGKHYKLDRVWTIEEFVNKFGLQ